jgi:hypothetical protein
MDALCAELKVLADDRFDVFGDADRAFALAMGSGARARLPGERFARNGCVRCRRLLCLSRRQPDSYDEPGFGEYEVSGIAELESCLHTDAGIGPVMMVAWSLCPDSANPLLRRRRTRCRPRRQAQLSSRWGQPVVIPATGTETAVDQGGGSVA